MQEVHTYFERKGYRGSILDPADTKASRRLYQKLGYQEVPGSDLLFLDFPFVSC